MASLIHDLRTEVDVREGDGEEGVALVRLASVEGVDVSTPHPVAALTIALDGDEWADDLMKYIDEPYEACDEALVANATRNVSD